MDIAVIIDELTNCLIDRSTEREVETYSITGMLKKSNGKAGNQNLPAFFVPYFKSSRSRRMVSLTKSGEMQRVHSNSRSVPR